MSPVSMLKGVEHANFVEQRATEYSRSRCGDGNEAWDGFDKRQKAKAGPAANEGVSEQGGDMFSRAGVAAE